ncbi:MAG: hypothetical protein HYZ84_07090 [Candidatus Omnitrophica bacterium]|nr:hypothetical protein [Candidatus Omnitrophota bacterium]
MNEPFFEEQDRQFMEKLKKIRNQPLPDNLLKDFSTSVEKRIVERQRRKTWMPVAAVTAVFVMMALAGIFLVQQFQPASEIIPEPEQEIIMKDPAVLPEANLSEELLALEELGVWTEEDEKSVGMALESALNELETAMDTDTSAFSTVPKIG